MPTTLAETEEPLLLAAGSEPDGFGGEALGGESIGNTVQVFDLEGTVRWVIPAKAPVREFLPAGFGGPHFILLDVPDLTELVIQSEPSQALLTQAFKTVGRHSFTPDKLAGSLPGGSSLFVGHRPNKNQVDPVGPASSPFRVLRGGAFRNEPNALRSASRDWALPDYRGKLIDFRGARPASTHHQK